MPEPITLSQPITFKASECSPSDCQRIVIGNNENCPGLQNPYFTGNPVNFWTLSPGLTQVADPLQVTGTVGVSYTISTTGIYEPGEYTVTLNITNNQIATVNVAVNGELLPGPTPSFTNPQFVLGASTTQEVTADVTIAQGGTWQITVALRANPSQPNLDATLNYISICPVDQNNTSYCFQLPLFQTGDELLSITDNEIDFTADFENSTGYNNPRDNTIAGACASPADDESNINGAPPTAANVIAGDGQRFHEIILGDVDIDWGLNINDAVSKKLTLLSRTSEFGAFLGDEIDFTESDANTNMFHLGTRNWDSAAASVMELYVAGTPECNGTSDQIKHDVTVNNYNVYPNFYEDTFSATDDTYYRLTFDLDKTTNVSVSITDSLSNPILITDEDGPSFSKIFNTGTLPAGSPDTLTIRWEISNLTEQPNQDFELAVLTSVELYEMCQWDLSIETTDEVFDSNLTETHDTETEMTGTVSYNKNILYCVDTSTLDDTLCYQFRAINSCDSNIFYTSNCVKVCKVSCDLNRLSWDHSNIKFIGDYCLDYFNYDYEKFIYVQVDFQDLTHEWEGVIYRDAAMFLQQPYSFFANTKVMQIWPLPGFARRAVAMALTDTFEVDGVSYRKLDDEAIVPQFNAVEVAPLRILVTQVGDFVESKNV